MLIDTDNVEKALRGMMKRSCRLREFAVQALTNQDQTSANGYEMEALGVDWCARELERALNRRSRKHHIPHLTAIRTAAK